MSCKECGCAECVFIKMIQELSDWALNYERKYRLVTVDALEKFTIVVKESIEDTK